jgi:ElaA protein
VSWYLKKFGDLSLPELYGILLLRNQVFVVEQKCPYQDIDGYDASSWHLFVEDKNGNICACLRILDKGQTFEEISIGRLAVRRDKREHGLARKMVQKATDFVIGTLHENDIHIEAQVYIKSFYEKMGFKPCSEVFLEDGIPHIEMFLHR